MSTYLVVNNSSLLCNTSANAPYIQVESEYLPLTTNTDTGRIDVHVTDEYTTYNVINLTTTTSEMTVESTVETTGYSGTYKDVEGEGEPIDGWGFNHVYALLTQTNTRYTINSYFLSGKSVSASTPTYITYTFADVNDENTLTNSSMFAQDFINCSARDVVKMPGTTSTYIRPKMTISGNDFIVHYSTTAYISSRITKYNSAYASNRSYYTTSVYSGVGTLYNSFATYTAYSSESNASASDYCSNLTSTGSVTLTDTLTVEVTSSSFTTQTQTDTQTYETTLYSGETSYTSSNSGRQPGYQYHIYLDSRLQVNTNQTGYISEYYDCVLYNDLRGAYTIKKDDTYDEITQALLSLYTYRDTTMTYPSINETWFVRMYPNDVTLTAQNQSTIYSITSCMSFDTWGDSSTTEYNGTMSSTLVRMHSRYILGMNSSYTRTYQTSASASESDESCSESYVTTVTETLTHTETITGEVH